MSRSPLVLLRPLGALACLLTLASCAPAASMAGARGAALSDGEVVAIAMAANEGEVVTSQPAVANAVSPAVRQFAQRMITDHTAALQQLQALGIAPVPNQTSRQLTQTAQETARALQTYSGAALDRTYMAAQVELHQYSLNTLDNFLIPSARNRGLRAMLQQMRATVAAHLEQAQQIRGSL